MAYNTNNLVTAGKITIYTTIVGIFVFAVAFLFNIGQSEVQKVVASTATTSVTVLNTPPAWTIDAQELLGSSTNTPTNAGDVVTWTAVGTDSNAENYYLLICSTSASPTPNSGAAPTCSAGVKWAVSTSTLSGTTATAATTTYAAMSEINTWFAWICDDNAGSPRCVNDYKQGTGTTSSPFEVNHRPSFTVFTDTSPAIPGANVIFQSTSTDADVSGSNDTVKLIVCSQAGFSTSTDTCSPGIVLASTTAFVAAHASSTYTIPIPTQDQSYSAIGYVIDVHGFEASGGAHGTDSTLVVSNATSTISGASISINGGSDMVLTQAASQTPGFTLSFTTTDNNSCVNAGATIEVPYYNLSLYRSGISSTTCTSAAGVYNANNCYPSGVSTSVWNLSCTASTTTCGGATDTTEDWNCTFPLWYIADPTDGTATSTQYSAQNWLAQVRAIDDNFATSSYAEATIGVEVTSLLAFALNTLTIPYGALEPGQQNDPLVATTTIAATGNVGLDKDVQGESMCTSFTYSVHCPNSSTSTINADEQRFATSTVSYASATALSSTTAQEIELNVAKSTSTVSQATGSAYWGIRVPIAITFAGSYTGNNTITARVGESVNW